MLGRVVIVGAGFAGASAARSLATQAPGRVEILLIDRRPRFVSTPLGQHLLAGITDPAPSHGYDGLRRVGVVVIHDAVTAIDPGRRRIDLHKLEALSYDRLVLADGAQPQPREIDGWAGAARERIPAALYPGPELDRLRDRLAAMPAGGVVVLSLPRAPTSGPAAGYERASLIADWLGRHNPRAKLLVLDANPEPVVHAEAFRSHWRQHHPSRLEYRPDSGVVAVDAAGRTLVTEFGDRIGGDVLNLMPPMSVGLLARQAGLLERQDAWCPADPETFESVAAGAIHLAGDLVRLPRNRGRTADRARQQGARVAAALLSALDGRPMPPAPDSIFAHAFLTRTTALQASEPFGSVGAGEGGVGEGGVGAGGVVRRIEGDSARREVRAMCVRLFG